MEIAKFPDFRLVPSPDVLRLTKHHVSAHFTRGPLDRAAERAAGRRCAALALASAGAGASKCQVESNADRSPAWPAGFVGSITHKAGFVSACAAPAAELASVGIDSEAVVSSAVQAELERAVTRPGELARIAMTGQLDEAVLFTLLFSAKESLYKCLYPVLREVFQFQDVEIIAVHAPAKTFRARLTLPREFELEGRFQLDDGMVHTALELPRS